MILIFVIGGSICGIMALSRIQRLVRDLENVRNQLRSLRDDLKERERQVPSAEKEVEVRPVSGDF
jgi:uncharacterized membrane protein